MEQIAALDRVIDAARDAGARVCAGGTMIEYVRRVAGTPVAFRVAGPDLAGHLLPAFEHLPPTAEPPAFTAVAWEARSSGVDIPRLPDAPSGPAPSRAVIDRARAASSTSSGRVMLEAYDQASATGWFAIGDIADLTTGERGAPFRLALHWWLTARGLQFAHGGAVGLHGTAVLIVGPTGAGKSSTTLSCVEDGFDYVADDYCAVDASGPVVHSLYSSAKLFSEDVHRYRKLATASAPVHNPTDDKMLVLVHRALPAQVVRQQDLGAIVVPARTHRPTTSFAPISRGAGLQALAPSTVGQFPGGAATTLAALAALSRSVPAYRLDLGTERATVAATMRELIEQLETS